MEKLIEHIKSTMHYTVIYNGVEYLTNDTVVVRIGATDKPDSVDFDNRLVGIKSEELFGLKYVESVVNEFLFDSLNKPYLIIELELWQYAAVMQEYAKFFEKGMKVWTAPNLFNGGLSIKINENTLIAAAKCSIPS